VPNPHVNEWYNHDPPPGTVYDIYPRLIQASLLNGGADRLNRLHQMAPYDNDVLWYIYNNSYRKAPTSEQARNLFGDVLSFNPAAMNAVASTVRDQPQEYESLMTNAAALDPAQFYKLGDYFLNYRKDPDKAAEWYAKGDEWDPDRLRAAAYADWRIRHYLKKGLKDTARRVADDAGDVYSQSGLTAKGDFFELTGDYAQAYEWYEKNEERYDDLHTLLMFFARYKASTGGTQFDQQMQSRILKLFPKSMEKVRLKDFQGSPQDGVSIFEDSTLLSQAGLHPGDVIVALNGVRMHNFSQYEYTRELTAGPELDLIVWQRGAYAETTASPPNHLFGVKMGDYPPK
jgi:tetratricopeptide (TPR) repeat protein